MLVVVWCFRASVRRGEDKNEAEVNKLHHPDSKEIKTKLGPSKNFVLHFRGEISRRLAKSDVFVGIGMGMCFNLGP
jgi:hypothetical protein